MTVYLLAGAAVGYALLVGTNPVRASLLDGLRAVQRYPRLWLTLGLFGFGYPVFQLALKMFPTDGSEAPAFVWSRPDGVWHLPPGAIRQSATDALLPALDNLGGLFNNIVSTFPLAAIAALLLLLNWRGHRTTLRKALAKRFGAWGWLLFPLILLAAVAALAKPALLVFAHEIDRTLWLRWAPMAAWLAFIFEYLFGVGVQVYLISLAYCWLRGLSFGHQQLLDFAIRRFGYVARWAFVLLALSTLVVDLPLILIALETPSAAAAASMVDEWNGVARHLLNVVFICFAAVQVTLVLHNESLRRSVRDHWQFVQKHPGPFCWFILIAAVHFYGLHLVDALGRAALGPQTAAGLGWTLLFPWLAGFIAAWLLAAWVSVFRRAGRGRLADRNFARY